jgi:hypothetical protein
MAPLDRFSTGVSDMTERSQAIVVKYSQTAVEDYLATNEVAYTTSNNSVQAVAECCGGKLGSGHC